MSSEHFSGTSVFSGINKAELLRTVFFFFFFAKGIGWFLLGPEISQSELNRA